MLTVIPANCFKNSGLKRIVVRSKITEIKGRAFEGCKELESLEINCEQLTEIGNLAFAESGIRSFPGAKQLRSIGDGAF